jgi:hypothetical protein
VLGQSQLIRAKIGADCEHGVFRLQAATLRQLASGELGKYRAVPAGVAYNKGTNFRDAKATKTSIFHALLEIHASARNVVINTISQLALAKEQKEWLWQAADHLEHKISPLVKAKIVRANVILTQLPRFD